MLYVFGIHVRKGMQFGCQWYAPYYVSPRLSPSVVVCFRQLALEALEVLVVPASKFHGFDLRLRC